MLYTYVNKRIPCFTFYILNLQIYDQYVTSYLEIRYFLNINHEVSLVRVPVIYRELTTKNIGFLVPEKSVVGCT